MTLNQAQGGATNPLLSSAMGGFAFLDWPPSQSMVERTEVPPLTVNLPVSTLPRGLNSFGVTSYEQDFYDRIHIDPTALHMGNVVTTQSVAVRLWNAYRQPKALESITDLPEGVQVAGQGDAPVLFRPLQQLTWQVSIEPTGDQVLDGTMHWKFNGGIIIPLRITANRIIAWAFVPNWSESVLERLTASTSILQSDTAVEQRRAMRLAPRRELTASMLAEGRERQMLDAALFGWGARTWALPIWPDIQQLLGGVPAGAQRINCETEHLDFREGGLAMLRGEDAFTYEVVEVDKIDATGITLALPLQRTWPSGTRFYPARTAQLTEQPSLDRLTDGLQRFRVSFLMVEPCEWPEVMPEATYRGWPVLELRPDESQDLTSSYQRLLLTLDSGKAIPKITDTAGLPLPMTGYRWLGMGRAERALFRSLVYAMNGQQKALWIPTHADDLTLAEVVGAYDTAISVLGIGYTRFVSAAPGRRDLRIELHDRTVFYRRITGSTETDDPNVERLELGEIFRREVHPRDVARISWMCLSRNASDTVDIEHKTDSKGVAASALTFRRVRDDEF